MTDETNADDGDVTDRVRRLKKAREREELDAEALERAHEDAHLVLEQALHLFSDLSDEAFRLVRLNTLVLTILIGVASQVRIEEYVNFLSVASLLLYVVSSLFALVGYLMTTVDRGIAPSTFGKLTEYKLRESEYLNWMLTLGYPKWIHRTIGRIETKEQWVRRSLVAFLAGTASLLAGILFTLY